MATSIDFWVGQNSNFTTLNGSGLGFFGSSFGNAVALNAYQDTTYVTNSNGTVQGPIGDNVKYTHANSGNVNSVSGLHLRAIPNYLASLNIRIESDSAIQTQNAKLYGYDRSNKNNAPSGVTFQAAELIHPWLATSPTGSGSTSWTQLSGSGSILSLSNSPGTNGQIPGASVRHDYYLALSAAPTTVGSKTNFGLWFEVEYI
jgi:hypothetical protein